MTTALAIYLSFSLLLLVGIPVWIGLVLHLGYTRLDEILQYLGSCSGIKFRTQLREKGPRGMFILMGWITAFVTFPNFFERRGEVSAANVRALPMVLRKKLIRLQWMCIGFWIWLIALASMNWLGLTD